MKKIKQWINKLSVRAKLVFYGYLIITPVLIFVCIALLFYNYQKVSQERLDTNFGNVNTLAESIHVLQTDIKDFSTYICINDEIHRLLTTDHPEEWNKDAKLWFHEAPMQIVQDMIALKGHIKTISIYPENGVRPYLRGMDGSVYYSDMESVKSTTIYRETIESKSGMLWKQIPKGNSEIYLSSRDNKVVLCREIFDLTQKKTLGYIVIGVSQEIFKELCQNMVKGEKECVIVLDSNGGELSRVGNLDKKVEQYLKSREFMEQEYQSREKHLVYGKYDIICRQISENSSIVCKIFPKYNIQMQILNIVNMPFSLLLGMLVGLLPLLLIISNIVTKPLRKVSEAIQKFSTGDFEQQVIVETKDEIGEVAQCFNKMVDDIRSLIDKNYVITLREKESELAALQAQINPHFLYNTLDSLYWQATGAGNEEIAESILALSQLFRLVLGQGKSEITVGQEMELVARYLQIQKMRFSKRLNYEICVEETIKKAKIPKLILQPFVENAIVHGFENVSTECFLKVSGKLVNETLWFEIQDTGIGMRQDQIDALWEEEPARYAKQRIGRYAIKNIRERLKLKYQDDFSLEIKSNIGKGTTVILIIPYEEEAVCQ